MTPVKLRLMKTIMRGGEWTASQLAKKLGMQSHVVGMLATKLSNDGYLVPRCIDPHNTVKVYVWSGRSHKAEPVKNGDAQWVMDRYWDCVDFAVNQMVRCG